MVALAHKGSAGRQFEAFVDELVATLAPPDRRDEPDRFGSLGEVRQWVEAIFDTPQRPARPGTPRLAHHPRGVDPDRPAGAGAGRGGLVQLAAGHRRKRSLVAYEGDDTLRGYGVTIRTADW